MTFDTIVMQAFGGLSLFTVLVLMALGLAIVFGLMGVINMAHGELMAMGAYVTYATAALFERWMPSLMPIYFLVGIVLAFVVTFAFGYALERGLIRFLYKRPLDTMLATWGLALVLQQLFRSVFGPREVGVPTTSWLEGAWRVTPGISLPLSRIFIIGLTIIVSATVYVLLYRSRWGLRIRAVTQHRDMSGAAGINTERVDAMTFAFGCGLAGIAGSSFTMLASTGPTTGQQYIVDTFIVVVFGGVDSLIGTFLSAFLISQQQSALELFFTGSMAKAGMLLMVIAVLYFRPNGLFALRVPAMTTSSDIAPLPAARRWFGGLRLGNWASGGPLALVLVGLTMPFVLGSFRLELVAKYLCFAFPAVGLVLLWGQTGILSLGQGLFFGMGSYFMAMFLKLEATTQSDSAQALAEFYGSTLPDFMVWNSVETLPWFWKPFSSFWFTVFAILAIPPLVSFAIAYVPFRRRLGGVYFSIVTLALASVASIVIIGQQGYTGGVNGITDFKTFAGMDLESPGVTRGLYYATIALLVASVLFGRSIVNSLLGKILVAVRDREDRVRFSGYDPAMFKAAIFAVAAVIAAIGGALFTLQVGMATPSLVGIVPSVEMVICAAVGGRLSLVGGVIGTLLVYGAKTFFSEHFAEYWLYFIGGLFIAVVVFLPKGLAGALEHLRQRRKAVAS